LGFWGKASDGAQDFYPISHLSKIEVYELARELGAPPEIMDAVPSGDLLFARTNDHKMIGATYDQIESILLHAEGKSDYLLRRGMKNVDNPRVFADNIIRNSFKYLLPFPGFHLYDRLETFRRTAYPAIKLLAETTDV